ncbi:MAG: SIR2 family protein, partial [Acidobacteriota bacterium]
MSQWREIPGNPHAFNELEALLASGDAIAFVGAGASAGLYPLWGGLIEALSDAAIERGLADAAFKSVWCQQMDALQAARQIRKRLGDGPFAEEIRRIFRPATGAGDERFTAVHAALMRLGFGAFVTTNYDRCLTFACEHQRRSIRELDWRDPGVARWLQGSATGSATDDGNELQILHAHGRYDDPSSLVLDIDDYRRAYGDAPRYRRLFEQLWIRERLVIVGFSLGDPWLRVLADLALSQAGAREHTDRRHIALIGLPGDELPAVELRREEIED